MCSWHRAGGKPQLNRTNGKGGVGLARCERRLYQTSEDKIEELADAAAAGQPQVKSAPVVIVCCGVPEAFSRKMHRVLRPGLVLTKRGIQLRPVIARLGDDVDEYRTLWNDRGRFKATIESLLYRPCPLCEGARARF